MGNYTDRSLIAITNQMNEHVQWPCASDRLAISDLIQREHGIPDCIGYIDGTQIFLENAPTKPNKGATAFWSRKKRYGLLLLCAVDHNKRFTYVHNGYTARSSDMRAQRASSLHTSPDQFLGPQEFLLGDSGFMVSSHIVPMYKKGRGEEEPTGRRVSPYTAFTTTDTSQAYFNTKAAYARVGVEHAFGVLKGRWQMLRHARLRLKSERDDQRAILVCQAAIILHNLLINTWKDNLTDEELRSVLGEENMQRRRELARARRDLVEYDPEEIRREQLFDQMLELDQDEIEL